MCGIAGTYSVKGIFRDDDIKTLTRTLRHRGPDGEGFYHDNIVQLGHRRLSILDLDVRASQPMQSADGRYVIVFNGEVYNFIELRNKIQRQFQDTPQSYFKTSGDTEVVLRLFEIYGLDSLQMLNGMFAMAVYDMVEKTLYIVRDRLGIKPLFYGSDAEGNVYFASELKAIKALANKIKLTVLPDAVFSFLQTGFIPSPQTIYKEVKKLPSGSFLKIDEKEGIVLKTYWSISDTLKETVITNETEALHQLKSLLQSSTELQLRSDVPYGVFLSGGIDSSLVTAIAAGSVKEKLNTFSIGFEEQRYNEAPHARKVAQHLGTHHHEFMASYRDAMNLVEDFFDIYDEPFADTSGINVLLISKMASRHVKVVLSGEGGDELFFGYGSHQWSARLNKSFYGLGKVPAKILFNQLSSRYRRISRLLDFKKGEVFLPEHIYSQEQYFFNSRELQHLLSDTHKAEVLKSQREKLGNFRSMYENLNRELRPEELQSLYELKFPLQDDLLTKVDRATMHHSIEARVPYLDHRVVEYAFKMSADLKIKNGVAKYPLKQLLYKEVPEELFKRPKQGFAIPLSQWLKNEWFYLIEKYLSKETVEKSGFVNYKSVEDLIKRFSGGENFLYNRIWNLIVLHRWFVNN